MLLYPVTEPNRSACLATRLHDSSCSPFNPNKPHRFDEVSGTMGFSLPSGFAQQFITTVKVDFYHCGGRRPVSRRGGP